MKARALIFVALALLVSGCAKSVYHWEGYDHRLENYLDNPDRLDPYVQGLDRVISKAEKAGSRVPPGIYAEYGRALYLRGEYERAIGYFNREKARYPESSVLMDLMVANAAKLSVGAP